MNLLQIQDQLKSLPNDPRTMQALTAYANGANPAVPPYLALGELNRRKQLIEKAQMQQASQPPQGTVKDQVEQQAGIMALQTGRQQQAMQNAMRMGSAMPQAAPANIPQPEAQAEVQAAGGGLMALLADKAKAKRMNSGGIVALSEAGPVNEAVDEAKRLEDLQKEADERRKREAPEFVDPFKEEQELMEKHPERFAALKKPIGADALARLEEVQAARRAELAKQREEAAAAKPGILQLLGQAALESRGQQGGSALATILGGYSKLQTGAEADALKQEQGLRMRELELQDVRRQAMDKIEDMQRAKAEGDMNRYQQRKKEFASLLKEHNVSIDNLLGRQLTAAANFAGRTRSAEAREEAAREATRRKGVVVPGEKERMATRIANLRAQGKDEEADALERAYRGPAGSGGTAEVGKINALRNNITAQIRVAQNTIKDYEASKEKKEAARAEIERLTAELRRLPTPGGAQPEKPSTPPPAGGKTITMAQIEAAAASRGKTVAEGVAAAKAKGYTIVQ